MITMLTVLLLLGRLIPPVGTPADTLVVTLRDVQGAGIAGVTVTVRDGQTATVVGSATTDAAGVATLPLALPHGTPVRVAVQGQLPSGIPLTLVGVDAAGIRLFLDTAAVTLALRGDATGQVVVDPALLAREPGIPVLPAAADDPAQPLPPAPTIAGHLPPSPDSPSLTAVPAPTTALSPAPLRARADESVPAQPTQPARFTPLQLLVLGSLLIGGVVALLRLRQTLRRRR